jgi:hypothetical protein
VIQEQEAKGEGKAQANVAITTTRMSYNQIKDTSFPCFTILYISHAMLLVTSYKYALYIINKV